MAHEKQCKQCNVTFVGFTPVCKECNAKKGEEISQMKASESQTKSDQAPVVPSMPGALSAMPRRSQKSANESSESNAPSVPTTQPNQKNIFNNNSYHNKNVDSTNYYTSSSAFGNGFNQKKMHGDGFQGGNKNSTNQGHQEVPNAFARMGRNQRSHDNTNHSKYNNYEGNDGESHGSKAFDFRGNNRGNNRGNHRGHQQSSEFFGERNAFSRGSGTDRVEETDIRNPFNHLLKICERHKEGTCKFGDRCRFLHEEPVSKEGKSTKATDRANISKERFGVRL